MHPPAKPHPLPPPLTPTHLKLNPTEHPDYEMGPLPSSSLSTSF